MKLLKLSLLLLCVLLSATCPAVCSVPSAPTEKKNTDKPLCAEWLMPDSTAYNNLGRKVADILMNATKVRAYSLVCKEKTTPDDIEIQPHFVRDTLLATLGKEQATLLKYSLLSCGESYSLDTENVIRSPFLPIIEFEFTKKKETAHVFISLSDFKWGILYEDKTLFKYNYADGIFIHRFCKYFLSKKNK